MRLRSGRRSPREGAFTLVELLVAAVVAAIALSAAYGWLWNVAAMAAGVDDRAQAATLAAVAARTLAADVRSSVAVTPPSAGRDPSRSLALAHDHVDVAAENVLLVWDPSRRVLWRNASGTYVADHVSGLALAFRLRDGRILSGSAMTAADWGGVTCVSVDLSVTVGSASVRRSLEASLGPA